MSAAPDLFADPVDAYRHWLGRISDTATMPDWVASALPDEPTDWMGWLINAASLSKIYADCALTALPTDTGARP